VLLVLAKSPVPGLAKTRLCPPASPAQAAALAAAALLDTLETVCTVSGAVPMVAWTGDLVDAVNSKDVSQALDRTVQFRQRGDLLGARIAAAHTEVADRAPGAAVLQIGMDTPQVTESGLTAALEILTGEPGPDAVLGPASDGGWWALGLRDPRAATLIEDVPMSRSDTGTRTLAALRSAGLNVVLLEELSDVDTAADALTVGARCRPGSRFAAEVTAMASVLGSGAAGPR
jgi:rSAM/selenodomain-associated transferase 1